MSLLLDHGHPDAWRYPLGMLRDEEQLIRQRINQDTARRLRDTHTALCAVINQDAVRSLNERISELNHV